MRTWRFHTITAGTALALGLAGPAMADMLTDFEPAGFVSGASVQALAPDGTPVSPEVSGTNPDAQAWSVRVAATDEEVVDISTTEPDHGKVWRLSDLGETGNLQTRPHSPHAGLLDGVGPKQTSGETGAIDDFGGETVTTNTFYGGIDFRSATGADQPGMEINVHASCGDDCRHGFVRIVDDGGGFDLVFIETGDNSGSGSCSSFPSTPLDLNLSYADWHTLGIEIFFVDGFGPGGVGVEGNDVVNIYVDGSLVHTGTSWETCYPFTGSGDPRSVDRLAFYRNSTALAATNGGLYIDNVRVTDVCPPGSCATDSDGDGIPDDEDGCPNSDLSPTVVIDSCDSGADNALDANGCTIIDLVEDCAAGAKNHGKFVSCVSHLLNGLKKDGVINGRDKGAVQRCAAQSDLP